MSYKRFNLRPLRLTCQMTDDVTECWDVHRGLIGVDEILSPKQAPKAVKRILTHAAQSLARHTNHSIVVAIIIVVSTELDEPTFFELECKASVAAWEEIRPSILHAVMSHVL